MGLPRKLQNMNVFLDGVSYFGEALEVTLPKLTRKTEEARRGVMVDMGQDAIALEHSYGGLMKGLFDGYGAAAIDAALVRFAGAYDEPATGTVEAVEITVRGRHSEIDPGSAKPGEKSEVKVKTDCVYYKLVLNGEVLVEIDFLNNIELINGEDRLAAHRAAIGL